MVNLIEIIIFFIKEKPLFVFNNIIIHTTSTFGFLYVFFGPFGLPRPILALWGLGMFYAWGVVIMWSVQDRRTSSPES